MSLTIGSLFSGIGGLELGLEWAGLGPVLWQVEKDPFCRRVLAKHWPDVPRFVDVQTVRASQLRAVDLICGGFPCQDVSSAGLRAGLTGARSGLWWEFARIIKEARPRFVVVENVASGASRWLCAVRSHLHQLGYRTRALGVAANEVGAHHRRARVFVVAYVAGVPPGRAARSPPAQTGADPHGNAKLLRHPARQETAPPVQPIAWPAEPEMARVVYGIPGRVDGRRALGNAVVPQCAQVVGEVIRQMLEVA